MQLDSGELPRYLLSAAEPGQPTVQLWSHDRLPFEPKGELRIMRNQLRTALESLQYRDACVLYGCYTSDVRDYACDTENILFFNVKDSGFPELSARGVMFERSFAPAPESPNPMLAARHHHHYEMRPIGEDFRHWKCRTIASWRDVPIEPLLPGTKPAPLWWAMKRTTDVDPAQSQPRALFGLRIKLAVPRDARFNMAPVVKPLLDGVIAGMHVHDGHDLGELSARLAQQLNEEPAVISALLMSMQNAQLGRRRLLHAWRQGVQWNPADDRCVAAYIFVSQSGNEWLISCDLLEVEERRA